MESWSRLTPQVRELSLVSVDPSFDAARVAEFGDEVVFVLAPASVLFVVACGDGVGKNASTSVALIAIVGEIFPIAMVVELVASISVIPTTGTEHDGTAVGESAGMRKLDSMNG